MSYSMEDCKIYSMEDVKRIDSATGGHFFDASALRFFGSRISDSIWRNDDFSGYFVTSEQNRPFYGPEEPRLYTVRKYSVEEREDGTARMDIETIGGFQEWGTLAGAKRAAKSFWRNHAYIH